MDEGDLTALLRQHASEHNVPGAAIGILREGAATTAYCGVANAGTGEPVTPETLFGIGSLTKSMVATVVARLAQAGQLSLDDPVAEHVPELRGSTWAQDATLQDLLANHSGIPLTARLEFDFEGREDEGDGAISRLAADVAAGESAGTFWSYSNVGWCLLGRVIETVTDAGWEDAMQDYLADARMTKTTFAAGALTPRRATGHEVSPEGVEPVAPLVARPYGPAGTTAVSTVTDLLRFATLHLEDASLAALRTVHADVSIYGWLDAWCLGWGRFEWAGGRAWGWDGVVNGERAVLRIVPAQQAAVALMTNGSTGRAMCRSLFGELMPPLLGMSVPPLRLDASPGAAGDLARFAGVYGWPDRRVEVTTAGGHLVITSQNGDTKAVPLDERTFLVDAADPDNPTVTFDAFDTSGRPGVLYIMLWGLPRLRQLRDGDRLSSNRSSLS